MAAAANAPMCRSLLGEGRTHHGGRGCSGGALQLQQGALYPALYRLEHQGLIESEWGTSENNRRAKFYRLTAAGRARLREELASWNRLADAITLALRTTPQEI